MYRIGTLILVGALLIGGASLWSGCATPTYELRDTAEVEALRLRITKVRNAIDETRFTIARSRGATYLPELYLRLAELLSEEARYHYQLAQIRERGAGADLFVPEVRLLKNEAIEIYRDTLRRFPESRQAARLLFNMGHEYRELGDFDEMLVAMQRLVEEYPDSPLRFQALIVLGDYQFDQDEMREAAHYYSQITNDDLSAAAGLAHYKMAWVHINEGECRPALTSFERAIQSTREWEEVRGERRAQEELIDSLPGVDQAVDVRRNSLADLAYCYSQEREASEGLAYFREWSDNRSDYLNGLARLARRFRLMDEYAGARDVSRELLRYGAANRDRLDDARTLYSTLAELEDFSAIDEDVRLINAALTRYHGQIGVSRSQATELFEEFELYVRDLVTSAQEEMMEARGDTQRELAQRVSRAYTAHLDTYLESPERTSVILNLAEVLALQGEHFRAGQRSLEAALLLDDEEALRDALYDAVAYFQTSLEREADRTQYESVVARAAMRSAGIRLLQLGGVDEERQRRVKFAIGESHYDAGEYDEAIDKLTLVAYEHPGSTQAEEAIRLVLDSYQTINDFDGLIYASRQFLAGGSPASAELQADIRNILEAAEQKKIDVLTLAAAGDDGVELAPLRDFAEIHRGTELGERALLNAFVAARSAGDTSRMAELADEIARDYPQSEELAGIFSSLAQSAAGRFEYEEAVGFLERAAEHNPDRRVQFLTAAGELRDELQEFDAAEALYKQAISASPGAGGRAAALTHLSQVLERRGSARQLAGDLHPYRDDGLPEVLVRLGLAELARDNAQEASGYFQRALSATGLSAEAEARAYYGLAEVMLATLDLFESLDDLTMIQEFITLADITQQNYLNAARQGSRRYTTVSLSRLAFALDYGANRLESASFPADMDSGQRSRLETAISGRVDNMRATAMEALDACSARVWENLIFDEVVRGCLRGDPWDAVLASYESPRPRRAVNLGDEAEMLRERVARDPQDVESLRELGRKTLEAGDPHLARVIFRRAVQAGGGGTELNLLGVASRESGDVAGAFEAFARAARAGDDEGRTNLTNLLRESGHPELAEEVPERF